MVSAAGEFEITEHDETNGIHINRTTPELACNDMDLIIPGENVDDVLEELAELRGYELITKNVAEDQLLDEDTAEKLDDFVEAHND